MASIKSFTDLNTRKEAHSLVLAVYKTSNSFPKEELYGLTSQIRRCAVSISDNIDEGFSRQSNKEKIQFSFTTKGSLTKLQNQLLITKDVGYITKHNFAKTTDHNHWKASNWLNQSHQKQVKKSIFNILYSIFKKSLASSLFDTILLLGSIPLAYSLSKSPESAEANWYNDTWQYHKNSP